MPRKLRNPKRRYRDTEAELDAWSLVFECGNDYFHETGFDRDEARLRARDVWQRLGALFLSRRNPAREARWVSWAQAKFGDPPS